MSMLWLFALLLVATVSANPPRVINLGTRFIPAYHNQYSELVARILRSRGYRVWSVHDVGALTASSTLNRRFYESSLGFSGAGGAVGFGGAGGGFVGGSVVDTRPTVTYETLYGGVDTSDLPNYVAPGVGPGFGPGLDGPGLDGPGLDGPGFDGPGFSGPGLDEVGPVGPGPLDGPELGPDSGFGGVGPDYDYYGDGGVDAAPYDTFSLSSRSTGPLLTGSVGTDFVTSTRRYAPVPYYDGESGFSSSSYLSSSPTYSELYNSRTAGFGTDGGALGGAGGGIGFSSGFVDTLPAYGASSIGYTDQYRIGGGGGGYFDEYRGEGLGGYSDGGNGGYFSSTYRPGYTSYLRRTTYQPRNFRTQVVTYPPQIEDYRFQRYQ